jgi:hypothetical protein
LRAAPGVPLHAGAPVRPEIAVQVRRHLPGDPAMIESELQPLRKRAHKE